jgi:hypothetical protein
MRGKQNEIVFSAFLDLEILVQDYRKAVLWLTHGNHDARGIAESCGLAGMSKAAYPSV